MSAYPSDAERADNARSLTDLAARITELAGHLNAANYRFLMLIAEFDRRGGWSGHAVQSCAHWLNWKCGIAMGAAREKVRTALALEKPPQIAAAMERGQLSYCKVRAITRVACEKTEEYFLHIAMHGTGEHIERLVSHWRRVKEAEEISREARQQANRFLKYRWDDDGSLLLTASLPADIGALVLKALEAAIEESPTPNPPAEMHFDHVPADDPIDKPSRPARRADALGVMAESFMCHGAEAMSGGDRHQIILHVSAETLAARVDVPEAHRAPTENTCGDMPICEIEDGPGVSAETARRFACDASIVPVLWPAGRNSASNSDPDPLNVGRRTRTIPSALRRALNARDRGCRFPGCTHTRYVDAHHIHHWAHGGETKPSNLVSLCRFHHRKVHEGAVKVHVLDDGALRFLQPDGQSFDSVAPGHTQPMGDWQQLPAAHRERAIHIDKETAVTRWGGESMDYGMAIQGLHQATRHVTVASA
ncbi:MAG TPA: DUF222 domain-containing protein [Steroidobacteraceae bacterium]|jgi:hypothetical protein